MAPDVGRKLSGTRGTASSESSCTLMPEAFIARTKSNESLEELRAAVGLSKAKARALRDLSEFYVSGRLSDQLLMDPALSEDMAIEYLTAVKGIGPWSAHMFLMFHLHRQDLLPLGDLGVRNGIMKHFGVKGCGKNGSLDEKKDKEKMESLFAPFAPYRSMATWYMWRALESKPYDEAME